MSLDLLTVDEAAAYLRTTPKALYHQRSRGDAPGALGVQVGRRILWDRRDLDEWFRSRNGPDPRNDGGLPEGSPQTESPHRHRHETARR